MSNGRTLINRLYGTVDAGYWRRNVEIADSFLDAAYQAGVRDTLNKVKAKRKKMRRKK